MILVQLITPANQGQILYTATSNETYRLFMTLVAPGNIPTKYVNIPMQQDQMYTYALSKATNVTWDDTCDIALLPPGQTTPNSSNYILYNSQIPHTINYIDLNLSTGESIYVCSYKGEICFTVLG